MEFLNNFVLPQSAEHIELLHYMLILIQFLFIPFISIVLGGIFLSVYFKRKAQKKNNEYYLKLAKDIAEITTINKSTGLVLGVLPVITSILIYSQLLHNSQTTNLNYLGLALIMISTGLVLVYSYRYSLTFNSIFSSLEKIKLSEQSILNDVKRLQEESKKISQKAGTFGFLFIFFGYWFFVAALTIPIFISERNIGSLIAGLFAREVLSRFIYYILFSFALTGGMILFIFLEEEKNKRYTDQNYSAFVKKVIIRATFIPIIFIPVFALFNLFGLPQNTLTGTVFTYIIISLVLLFLGYHFLYLLTKEHKGKTAALLFFTLIFSVAANIISDQKAMATSTKVQSTILSAEFDKYLAGLKGEGKTVELNGAEIYEVKCASCHKWDQKLVGPAHKDVIPKYVGKEAQLVAFIRNPVKVDPAFPQMPNPGLKPDEAKAVADYLLKTYNEKNK